MAFPQQFPFFAPILSFVAADSSEKQFVGFAPTTATSVAGFGCFLEGKLGFPHDRGYGGPVPHSLRVDETRKVSAHTSPEIPGTAIALYLHPKQLLGSFTAEEIGGCEMELPRGTVPVQITPEGFWWSGDAIKGRFDPLAACTLFCIPSGGEIYCQFGLAGSSDKRATQRIRIDNDPWRVSRFLMQKQEYRRTGK